MPDTIGLQIATSDFSVIRGLAINRYFTGIAIGGDSVANRIEGNFIGTDPSGTLARGNLNGVALTTGASESVVGGDTPAARNTVSANRIGIIAQTTSFNTIQGNYVGTDKGGTKKLGNLGEGVFILSSPDTTIGGTTAATRNVISGNGSDGLLIEQSRNVEVLGNHVGTTASGTGALGNALAGVELFASSGTVGDGSSAGANTIAFNGKDGIVVEADTSTGNAATIGIVRNSVFSNGGLGIDLVGGSENAAGITANDPGDVDSGPNGLQNFPILTSARTVSGKTTMTGKLASTPNRTFVVQFFSNLSGNEGKKFVGEKFVSTDASGNVPFSFSPAASVPAGQTITATAINVGASFGDTSEFSAPRKVAAS